MRKSFVAAIVLLLVSSATLDAAEYYTKHKGDTRRGDATEDTALVYFFRPATMGAAIKTWAFVDDTMIGVSKAKGYYFALVPPGNHLFWSAAENASAVELEVNAGETYYFKQAIKMGLGKARVKMLHIDEQEAEKYFGKCSFCEPTEEGRTRGAEIAANRMDAAEKNAEKRKSSK